MHRDLVNASALFALNICKALRDYKKTTLQDIREHRQFTWDSVHQLWDLGPDLDPISDSDINDPN